MLETTHLQTHLDELSEKKWTLFSVDPNLAQKLLQNAKLRLQMQQFHEAELASTHNVVSQIRNDRIFWLDAKLTDLSDVESQLLMKLETIKDEIKNYLRVSLNNIECHYAFYESGHFYQKHRDTTLHDNKRILTFVLYLNENWKPEDAGQLVAYEGEKILFEANPKIGTLILFQSELEHEVKPTLSDRYSLTGWFRC